MIHPIYILTDAQGTFIAASESRDRIFNMRMDIWVLETWENVIRYKSPLIITVGEAVWEDKKI